MKRKLAYEDAMGAVRAATIRPMRLLVIVTQVNYPWRVPSMDLMPQGPAYVAGSLKAVGHHVRGVCTSYDISGELGPAVLERRLKEGIAEHQPDAILLGGMAAEFLFLRDAINFSRKYAPDVPIICGGSIFTNDPTSFELLRPDFGVRDEAEITLVELLDRIDKGTPLDGLLGAIFWRDGQPVYNGLRPAIEDLDSIPYPDYEVLDIDNYLALCNQVDNYWYTRSRSKPRPLPASSGRSCPYKCTFCQYSTIEGSRRIYRGRSMDSFVEEIQYFYEKHNFNLLMIYDDLFSVKADRILEFCQLMREARMDLHWNASMRVGDVTTELLREMKSAGCIHVGYGFESADDGVLKSMKKGITRDLIARAIAMSEEVGIGVQANFIYGDPAETPDSIAATGSFFREKCLQHIVHCDHVTPYPGSPIFDFSLAKGVIKDKVDWYETIHLRPHYNMTQMSEQQFHTLIEPELRWPLTKIPHAENIQFSEASRDEFNNAYFNNRILVKATSTCVHCKAQDEKIFPVPARDFTTPAGGYSLFEPIRNYCGQCHRGMLFSLLPLSGLEADLNSFVHTVDELREAQTPLVLAPLSFSLWMDLLEARGVSWKALNVRALMSTGRFHDGTAHGGTSIIGLDSAQIRRNAHLDYLVLPGPWESEVVRLLESNGIKRARVHAMARAFTETPSESRLNALWCKRSNGFYWWADKPMEDLTQPTSFAAHWPGIATRSTVRRNRKQQPLAERALSLT